MKTYTITITDAKTGETYTTETVRTAGDIFEYLVGSENDAELLEEMTKEEI